MRAIFTVFAKEFRENLRDRRTLFTALIFGPLFSPLLFAAVLGLMIQRGDTQQDKPLELAVSHTERAPNLVATLIEYGVTVRPVTYDDVTARKAIESRKHRPRADDSRELRREVHVRAAGAARSLLRLVSTDDRS